jgi:hypothetical protein
LEHSVWIPDFEHALENFSLGAFLDDVYHYPHSTGNGGYRDEGALRFFNHLKANVSFQQSTQVSASAYHITQNKSDLHRTHAARYLEHAMFTINSHPSAEKFYLLITVWFVLQEHFQSDRSESYYYKEFERLCVALFGFDSTDIAWDRVNYRLMRPLFIVIPICGHIAETKSVVPEPILSHRLARVAISCTQSFQYLFHRGANAQDQLLSWAIKSKQSPWLWRQRMRFTSTRRHVPNIMLGHTYSFPHSLRRLRQILYSEKIQSEKVYQVQRKFYTWTLNILYLTLCKARKSDELTGALSELFIPLSASILFPRQIKRVRKAIDAYLDKVSRRACSDSTRD